MSVAIRYLEAWLRGLGAVAIDNLMEDAATAEISRSQVWQWIHQDRTTEDGTPITRDYVEGLIAEVLGEVERRDGDRFDDAAEVFREVALREEFPAFLTLTAYSRYLVETRLAAASASRSRLRVTRVSSLRAVSAVSCGPRSSMPTGRFRRPPSRSRHATSSCRRAIAVSSPRQRRADRGCRRRVPRRAATTPTAIGQRRRDAQRGVEVEHHGERTPSATTTAEYRAGGADRA